MMAGSPPRILIVAEHDDARSGMQQSFEGLGFDVQAVHDIGTAAACMAWFPARLVVVDMTVATPDVLAALKAFCRNHPSTSLVVATKEGDRRARGRYRPGTAPLHLVTAREVVSCAVSLLSGARGGNAATQRQLGRR